MSVRRCPHRARFCATSPVRPEAAEELEDGVLLDAFRQQRSFGGGCMTAESGSLAHCQQAYGRWGGGTRATSGCDPAAVVSSLMRTTPLWPTLALIVAPLLNHPTCAFRPAMR